VLNMQKQLRKGMAALVIAGVVGTGAGFGTMPAADAQAAANISRIHTVASNDTMYRIAVRYGVGLQTLIAANPQIKNPSVIWQGMRVNIPGASIGSSTGQTGTTVDATASFAKQVVALVNAERAKAGLQALTSDGSLTKVAYDKAVDMHTNNYFSHQSPTYGSPFDMMRTYGVTYRYAGENIAKGQRTPAEVMQAWMNSPGHRANILSANFSRIGAAYYKGEWVQAFTG
jgi:uncharacterized YkwD family protein/spore coat assembly protein SafA